MKKLILLIILTIGISPITFAESEGGGKSGGGGDVFVCGKRFSKKTYFADTYEIIKGFGTRPLNSFSEGALTEAAFNIINIEYPDHVEQIRESYDLVTQNMVFVEKLEELENDFLDVPNGCVKKQLAIQNVQTGKLRVHEKRFNRLSDIEKVFFKLHEALIHFHQEVTDTTDVRKSIFDLYAALIKQVYSHLTTENAPKHEDKSNPISSHPLIFNDQEIPWSTNQKAHVRAWGVLIYELPIGTFPLFKDARNTLVSSYLRCDVSNTSRAGRACRLDAARELCGYNFMMSDAKYSRAYCTKTIESSLKIKGLTTYMLGNIIHRLFHSNRPPKRILELLNQ